MKKLLNKKGFTLIELIVVIAILAILALILIPSITGYIGRATEAKDSANARTLYTQAALKLAVGDLAETETKYEGCDVTIAGGEITEFSCVIDGKTYKLTSNFKAE